MTLDTTLSAVIRTHLLCFVISAFQSLDSGIVRKECAPLVSISTRHNISSEKKREKKLDQNLQLRKAWRAAAKRYDAADEATKPRLRFERSWLFTLILDFFDQLYNEKSNQGMCFPHVLTLCTDLIVGRKYKILRAIPRILVRSSKSAANQEIHQHASPGYEYPLRDPTVPCF